MTAKRWITTAVLALAVAAAGSAFLFAQGGPGGPGRFGRGRGPMAFGMMGGLRALNLSDAQRSQIKSVVQSHRDEMKAIGERLRTAHQALQEAIEQAPVNESLVRQRAADVAAVQADAAVLRSRVHAQVFQVLTPEQQAKAKELRQQAAQRMQQRMQKWQQRRQQKPDGTPGK